MVCFPDFRCESHWKFSRNLDHTALNIHGAGVKSTKILTAGFVNVRVSYCPKQNRNSMKIFTWGVVSFGEQHTYTHTHMTLVLTDLTTDLEESIQGQSSDSSVIHTHIFKVGHCLRMKQLCNICWKGAWDELQISYYLWTGGYLPALLWGSSEIIIVEQVCSTSFLKGSNLRCWETHSARRKDLDQSKFYWARFLT
jgi:hypothetical protein